MSEILARHAVTILLAAIWWLLLTGVGRLCVGSASLRTASRGELLFVSFGTGLVIVGYAVFLLGIAGALQPVFIAGTLSLLAALALAGWIRRPAMASASNVPMPRPLSHQPTNAEFRDSKPDSARFTFGFASRVEPIADFALFLLLAAAFLLTLTPEMGKDALIQG